MHLQHEVHERAALTKWLLEPELYAPACAHVYGRYGYATSDADPEASLMRRMAIVGVSHGV